MKLEDVPFQLRVEIAEHYNGTCWTASEWALDGGDTISDEDVLSILGEQEIEECTTCGWWSELAEMDDSTGELVCSECAEPAEDD